MLRYGAHFHAELRFDAADVIDVHRAVLEAASPVFRRDNYVHIVDLERWAVRAIVADIYASRFDVDTLTIDPTRASNDIGVSCKAFTAIFIASLRFGMRVPKWTNIRSRAITITMEPGRCAPTIQFEGDDDATELERQKDADSHSRRFRVPQSAVNRINRMFDDTLPTASTIELSEKVFRYSFPWILPSTRLLVVGTGPTVAGGNNVEAEAPTGVLAWLRALGATGEYYAQHPWKALVWACRALDASQGPVLARHAWLGPQVMVRSGDVPRQKEVTNGVSASRTRRLVDLLSSRCSGCPAPHHHHH
jgi:hypothetical protein